MTKELKILFNFTSYLLLGVLICLIGLSDVFASTYTASQFEGKLFDNFGPSLSGVTTSSTSGGWSGTIPSMTANSSGAAWGFSSPIPIIANHTYALSVVINGSYGGNLTLSTYNRIGIGSSMSSAEESYENNTKVKESSSKALPSNDMLQFVFTAESSASYIVFPFATTYSGSNQNFVLSSVIIDDLGSNSLTQDEINNSLTNQTNTLNNSIDNSTNIITGEIDNLGENIKDSINDANTTCGYQFSETITYSDKSPTSANNEYLTSSGTLTQHNSLDTIGVTDYKRIFPGTYLISANNNALMFNWVAIAFYDKDKNVISTQSLGTNLPSTITLGDNVYYFRATVRSNGYTLNLKSENSICVPNSFIEQQQNNETNNQLGDLNNNITNDNIDNDNVSNAFNQFEDFIDENSTVSSLLTLPVTLFTAILNGMNNSCSPFNLGSLYGEDLILPCINISSYLGNTLWTMIDIIISGFAIYFISKKFIKVFNTFSSMKEGDVIDD